MAEKEFDPEDPFTLTGMVMPLSPDRAKAAEEEMAACFIEEYMMMGNDAGRILELFKDPFYRGTNAVYKARGEAFVRKLIDKVRQGAVEAGGRASPEPFGNVLANGGEPQHQEN